MVIDALFIFTAFLEIIKALPLTLTVTIVPLLAGLGIGLIIAVIRMYKIKFIHRIAEFYVSFFRGTPILLHIMVIYLGIPMVYDTMADQYGWAFKSNSIPIAVFVIIAFSLNSGAYMSEIIRSGILAVNKGQIEAAYSIGMSSVQTIRRIIIPQAFAAAIQNLTNIFVGFLHASSIAFIVSLKELNGAANIVASSNLKFLEAYIAAALIYWGLTIIVEQAAAWIERRVLVYEKGV
ncbi:MULTISPECIES: amino acid ABC transporter permease [Metabacillus]|uniref:Amino acid ABC transporter permease n=1 Tax=Metabacillus hrfriensis TaxID=3048891 RepID=A0ACD4R6K2_9BACI|nr:MULTISPECIES: amino acid ABC transporter permease [Metabacillus]UAL50602.1 amino acid ABC transporter permease [Metabacillus dongyingensis]USK26868.1 amino acid ABC transporter permease [Bacillus sp. CMF21]WHZ56098.1 amino acid ABC transporter permease [Metabacillus sp. CT-WN-B3]